MSRQTRCRGHVFASIVIMLVLVSGNAGIAQAAEKKVSPGAVQLLSNLSDALAEVGEVARPAVVNISTTSTVKMGESPLGGAFNDPFFRHFFGAPFGPEEKRKFKQSALGSGVIVSEDGYILTNNHVVKGAETIKVILYDKREFKGKIIGTDPKTDLAVVKIDAKNLPTMKLGQSGKMKAGDIVLAIGNPFALNQTITMGIISAVGRANLGLSDIEDFIQTDAAINPGNSGGALVNANGELIGINTAIFSTSGGYIGIGFAIPSDMARPVFESIIKHGRVIRGWLGVSIQDLTPDLAKSLHMPGQTGVLVADVVKGSPAEKAGFKRGDVIKSMNGKTAEDSTNLRNMIAATAPGTRVNITVIRDGKEMTLTPELQEFKEQRVAKKTEYNNVLKGITVEDITPSIRDRLNLPQNLSGVVVTEVSQESPAQELVQQGDIILEVDRKEIKNVDEYDRIASKIGAKDTVLLLLYRDGATVYITVNP